MANSKTKKETVEEKETFEENQSVPVDGFEKEVFDEHGELVTFATVS